VLQMFDLVLLEDSVVTDEAWRRGLVSSCGIADGTVIRVRLSSVHQAKS